MEDWICFGFRSSEFGFPRRSSWFRLRRVGIRALAGGLLVCGAAGVSRAATSPDDLFAAFQEPTRDGKPFVYWWWQGNDVTEAEIARQLELLQRAGIAGVHIFPLGKPTGKLEWLSPDWWRLVRYAVDEARRRGLQVDINAGYGWPSGGTFVPPEHRLQAISCAIEKLRGPARFERKLEDFLPRNLEGQRSFAFVRLVPLRVDRLSQVHDLGPHVRDDILSFPVPEGDHLLYAGIHRRSARPNKVSGQTGDYALDYFDRAGVQHYLAHFAGSFHAALGGRFGDLFHAFFVSSVEIWPANWTTGFAGEFQRRRGYDLLPYAHFATGMYPIPLYQAKNLRPDLFTASPQLADEIRRVRYDYNKTLVELFQENFVETTQRWCRDQGVLFRYQAYGFPWNIGMAENYLVPDIPEGNNWILSDVADHGWEVWNKYAAAGGHLTGKRLISNEAMTTTKGKFRETLDRVKRADDFNFVTGNTRSVVHGFCYSPVEAPPPGRHQYGTFLSEHNPWWPYFPRWTAYNARISQVLQSAAPVVDVAILCPTADVWSDAGLNRVAQQTTPRYGYKLWESLSQQGVSADYLHEAVLQKATFAGGLLSYGPMRYGLLILCDVATLEPATAAAIRRYVEAGGQLVIVGQPPVRSPGLTNAVANDQKVRAAFAAAVQAGAGRVIELAAPGPTTNLLAWAGALLDRTLLPRRVVFAPASEQLFQVHYRAAGREIFFLCNQDSAQRVASTADFRAGRRTPWRWDPETGARTRYPVDAAGMLRIDLGPGESLLLVFEPEVHDGPTYALPLVAGAPVQTLETRWNLQLHSYRREETVLAMQPLVDLAQSATLRDFAGTVDYETTFELPTASLTVARVLDLGPINGVSEAWLNGQPLGVRWYGLHHYDVTGRLQPGRNALRVRVATLLWNGVAGPKEPREAAGLAGPVLLRHGETRPTTP
jgi:hypothetical protein